MSDLTSSWRVPQLDALEEVIVPLIDKLTAEGVGQGGSVGAMIAVIVDVFFVVLETIVGTPIGRRLRSDVPGSKRRRRWWSSRRGDSA